MTRTKTAVLAVFAIAAIAGALPPAAARAAKEYAVQITQPLKAEGTGFSIVQVPYLLWFKPSDDPHFAVSLTVAANTITTGDGTSNRNAANLLGVQLSFPAAPSQPWRQASPRGLFGDTLRVSMDLSKTGEAARLKDEMDARRMAYPRKEVLSLTLFSMIENARRGWPRVKHLTVEVQGSDEFKDLAGTYSLESTPAPPEIREIGSWVPKKE
jgi:hypothetical protein